MVASDKPGGAACATCPARLGKIAYPRPAVGKARLAVVGEQPMRFETDTGRIFDSPGAALLERGLRTIGVQRSGVHWTNAVLCDCPKDDLQRAAKACRTRLHEELAAVNAPAVVTLGNPFSKGGSPSLKSVLKPKSANIREFRGSISALAWRRSPLDNKLQAFDVTQEAAKGATRDENGQCLLNSKQEFSYVLPILHPAFVQRAPEWAEHLQIDVARIGRVLHDIWISPEHQEGRTVIIARDNLDCLDALREVEIAADVETSGLGCMSTNLTCFVLADRKTACIIPWSKDLAGKVPHWGEPEKVAAHITRFMSSRIAVTHNGFAFDYPIFGRYGIYFARKEDTLVGAHAIASELPKKLSHVATTYLDIWPWKEADHGSSLDLLHYYCANDGFFTILSRHAQREQLC